MSGKKSQAKDLKLSKQRKVTRTRQRRSKTSRSMQGLAPIARNPMKGVKTKMAASSCHTKGTDYLCSINVGATAAAAGDVLYTTVVNPSTLGVSRLATFSRLYERYKFRSLKFRYAPVANATVSGQLIGYVDYDTYDDPTGVSGVQNLQRAAAHFGEKPVQVWQGSEKPVFWEIKDIDPMTDLYVDTDGSDARWTNQGRFVLLAASTIGANQACGNIYIDYEIDFYIPQVEISNANGAATKLTGTTDNTTSAILGTSIAAASWSSIPYSMTGNVLTLPPGSYLIVTRIGGTGVSALANSSDGTTVYAINSYLTGTTGATAWIQAWSLNTLKITFSAVTSTSIASGMIYICQFPRDAISISERKLARIEQVLNRLKGSETVSRLSVTYGSDSKEAKTSEEKEQELKSSKLSSLKVDKDDRPPLTRYVSSMSCSSTSSSSSGSFPTTRDDIDEQYVRIPRKS